ncbi:MAG TPA: hypothetical protein VHE79_06325 [Spirochaetia bacterium]
MSSTRLRDRWPGLSPAARGLRIAGIVVAGVVGAAVFALAFGWLVMLLWNWLMPEIFHLGTITYWQGFGIIILAKLIFGAMRGGHVGPRHGPWMSGPGSRSDPRAQHMRDRWKWYHEFWEAEGRQAFDRFVREKESQSPGDPGATPAS